MNVQRALTARGFPVGRIDGVFGRRTRGAIRDWQLANAVAVTGYLDAPGVRSLLVPVGESTTERLRTAEHSARMAAALGLESARRRSTALLAIVLEQVTDGKLGAARTTALRIEDARKRKRALERIREAGGQRPGRSAEPGTIPPAGAFVSSGP